MSDIPSVAICIPTYNQAQYLSEAVLSACRQTYSDVQVWVSDDASSDDTPNVLADLSRDYPQIKVHRRPNNCGIAENNSWLLAQPKTDYIVRLDSDDAIAPNYVETLVDYLQKYPDAGYAHISVQEINGQGHPGRIRRLARQTGFQDADTALKASVPDYRVAANIVMFRTSVLHELNFYAGRPEFVEDYDLSVRIADAGYGNVYINQVLANYRIWTDDGKKRLKRKHLQLTGYVRIYDESMKPAFSRRGWNTSIIGRQRRRMALHHSAYCFSDLFDLQEREELAKLLVQLGDSLPLRLKIIVLKLGFGFLFHWQEQTESVIKQCIKQLIAQLQSVPKLKRKHLHS